MDEELQIAFGRNMQALRRERGLTQAGMAEAMGNIDRTYVGAIERGEKNLGLKTVARLCRLAEVDPFDLLRRPDEVPAGDAGDLRAAATGDDPGSTQHTGRPRPT